MSWSPVCLIGLAAFATIAGWSGTARAGCSVPPAIVWAPPSGAVLPANPTIYIFVPQRAACAASKLDELTVTDPHGRPVVFTRADLRSEGAAEVVRLDIKVAARAVSVGGRVGTENGAASYRIGARGRDPDLDETEITEARYVYGAGCPGANGFLLSIDPQAPAYRVQLDEHVWIVPDGEPWRARHGTIVTGSVGCETFAIPTDRPLALSITPLETDGSEGATRDQNCAPVGPRESCRSIGHGKTRCTVRAVECSNDGTFRVTGRVVLDGAAAPAAPKKATRSPRVGL